MAGGATDAPLSVVMAGLDPAIHVFMPHQRKTWMPATSAGMTSKIDQLPALRRQSDGMIYEKANS
jgi:hypothetical protein